MASDRAELRELGEQLLVSRTGAQGVVRLCPRCGSGDHGRPVLVGAGPLPQVSLSYAAGLVAVAWSSSGRVGVDVERDGPAVPGYGDRTAWTRTEALLKHAGTGLAHDPREDLPGDVPTQPLPLPPGYVGTVAGRDVSWLVAGPAVGAGPGAEPPPARSGTGRRRPAR